MFREVEGIGGRKDGGFDEVLPWGDRMSEGTGAYMMIAIGRLGQVVGGECAWRYIDLLYELELDVCCSLKERKEGRNCMCSSMQKKQP